MASQLGASVHAVWRVLRREGIYLQRLRSWCVSTEAEFGAKAADVVGFYLNPPLNAIVLSVDEKPSIQAIERSTGYIETDSGAVVRALKSTYKRLLVPKKNTRNLAGFVVGNASGQGARRTSAAARDVRPNLGSVWELRDDGQPKWLADTRPSRAVSRSKSVGRP